MNYSRSIKQSAAKSFETVPKPDRLRIIDVIDALRTNPAAGSLLKGELSGLRRVRVGSYRAVYEVVEDRLTILLVRIGHRRDVFR